MDDDTDHRRQPSEAGSCHSLGLVNDDTDRDLKTSIENKFLPLANLVDDDTDSAWETVPCETSSCDSSETSYCHSLGFVDEDTDIEHGRQLSKISSFRSRGLMDNSSRSLVWGILFIMRLPPINAKCSHKCSAQIAHH